MITIEDYIGDKLSKYASDYSIEIQGNIRDLLAKVNLLLTFYQNKVDPAFKPKVNSGWRPKAYNDTIPTASKNSKHIIGCAIDIKDEGGKLAHYLSENQTLLETCNLFMEHPSATFGWCHLQSKPFYSFEQGTTKSRVFKP